MFFESFVGNIYESLREICATSGTAKLFQTSRVLSHYSPTFPWWPCHSEATGSKLSGGYCWPLSQLTRCGLKSKKSKELSRGTLWLLSQLTHCVLKSNKSNELSRGTRWPLYQVIHCGLKSNELIPRTETVQHPLKTWITLPRNCYHNFVGISNYWRTFNPLNLKMILHILRTVLLTFLMLLLRRIY